MFSNPDASSPISSTEATYGRLQYTTDEDVETADEGAEHLLLMDS
jgi:hypothetical protein